MPRQSLFDSGPRYGGPLRHSESQFAFLNRVDGPAWQRVRELLEAWYAEHPDPDGDLRARFREHDIHQHAPAWWELYTYTLFQRLGYTVTVEPAVPRGKADLLVTRPDSAMYVECVVVFDDGSSPTSDGQAWVCECIDNVNNPDFYVGIRGITAHGAQRPKQREITKPIEAWLGSLDYDSVKAAPIAHAALPSEDFEFRGWRVSLIAIPINPDRRGTGGGRIAFGPGSGMFEIRSVEAIRVRLDDKARQCQGVDAPLVVAMLNWTTFGSPDKVDQAVFGSQGISYRLEDGYWHPGPPPRGGRVSAVMFSQHLCASRVLAELPTLWLNPWANKPLLDRLPFATRTAHDTGEVFLAAEATTIPEVVFDLPPNWPDF